MRKTIPNDLVPFAPGYYIQTTINPDGTKGKVTKTFAEFLLSVTPTTTRASEDLETGGANIPMVQSESDTITVVMNALSEEMHSQYSGETFEYGSALVMQQTPAKIVKSGDAGSEVYSFVFTDTKEYPTANAEGEIFLVVTDKDGYALEDVSTSTEAVAVGQFKYDSATKTISVSADYDGETLEAMFEFMADEVITATSKDVIDVPLLELRAVSYLQSALAKQKYVRYEHYPRVSPTGDVPSPPAQKAVNTNMNYVYTTQTPPTGMKRKYRKTVIYKGE